VYLRKTTEKSKKFINGINMQALTWSIKCKLIIYKTFIRPIQEYGLPLLTNWIRKQKDSSSLENILKDSYLNGIRFIFGKSQPLTLLETISGLGTHSFRIAQLEASLARHLAQLGNQNPLFKYMREQFISSNPNFIITSCRMNQLWTKWMSYKKSEKFPVQHTTWIKIQKMEDLKAQPGKLHQYIFNRCKTRAKADAFLMESDPIIKYALLWRSNRSFMVRTCPICSFKFNRAHLERCDIYNLINVDFEKIKNGKDFKRDINLLQKNIGFDSSNYTILDFYLNNREYDRFQDTYVRLKNLLDR
jgi:hypothetical protein